MTVKDAVKVLKTATKIVMGYGANAVAFDKDDPLVLDAYGNYLVDSVSASDEEYYEVNICMRPVKVGDN